MATPNDSIFELGDQFGISSPFGDWLEKGAPESPVKKVGRQSAAPKRYEDLLRLSSRPAPQDDVNKGAMLVLSDVIDPQNGVPGSAHFTIQMTYRLITSGEGEVHIRDQISPEKFSAIFSRGDIPQKNQRNPQFLQYASLPTPEIPGVLLTPEQILLSKKKDNQGQPRFWEYYNVSVTYKFELEKIEGFNLVAGITWMMEEVEARGIIFNVLFENELIKLRRIYNMSPLQYQNELSPQKRKEIDSTGEEYFQLLNYLHVSEQKRLEQELVGMEALLVVMQSLQNDPNAFLSKAVYIGTEENQRGAWRTFYSPVIEELFKSDIEFRGLLNDFGSEFFAILPKDIVDNRAAVMLEFENHCMTIEFIRTWNRKFLNHCIDNDQMGMDVGAMGNNEDSGGKRINFVVLNPVFSGLEASRSAFSFNNGLDIEEMLAHEAAHNCALDFKHTKEGTGNYEYNQEGLQSNMHLMVYPTIKNTEVIINDYLNRRWMQIQ